MRKLIGLLFLTTTLTAASANAQGIFIDRGDPSAISASVGGRYLTDKSWAGGLTGSWTYHGVFDVGADLTYMNYQAGDLKKLAGINVAPFLTWHIMRGEEEELPISFAMTLQVAREFFTGNDPVANPEGWGVFVGPSVYRKIELGAKMAFVPEILAGYEAKATRRYSSAVDQPTGTRDQTAGYATDMKHSVRALARLNLLFKTGGNTRYTVTPYLGYHGGVAGGLNLGALF